MRDHDWLERFNFHPAQWDGGANPFLREHLPAEDIRLLERASIASSNMLPVGLVSLGAFLGQFSSAPSWLTLMVAGRWMFHGFRGMRRVEIA